MKITLKKLFYLTTVIIILIYFVVEFIPFSHPAIINTIRSNLHTMGVDSCSIGAASLSLWRGIECRKIVLQKSLSSGHSVIAEIPKLIVSVKFFTLLRYIPVLIQKKQENFKSELTTQKNLDQSQKAKTTTYEVLKKVSQIFSTASAESGFRNIECSNIKVIVLKESDTVSKFFDITAKARKDIRQKKQLNITFESDSICILNKKFFSRIKASAKSTEKIFVLTKIAARCCAGYLNGSLSFDLSDLLLQEGKLNFSDINLSCFSKAIGIKNGKIGGKANIFFKFGRSLAFVDSLNGRGRIILKQVELADFSFQKNPAYILLAPSIKNINFEKITSKLELQQKRLYFVDADGEGLNFNMEGNGWIGLNGIINMAFSLILSPQEVNQLPPLTKKSLVVDDKGRHKVCFSLSGSITSPSLVLDKRLINRAFNSVLEEIGNKLQNIFK